MSTGSLPPLDLLSLLPGAQPDPGADPLEFLYGLPPPQVAQPTEAGLPPTPPTYTAPATLPVPRMGFMDRFSTALAGVPQFNGAMPMEGPGQAFARGLVGGVAGGISRSGAERMKRAETERAETNATRKSEADRNYAAAMKTWETKLVQHYKTKADREGKILLTPQMATDSGTPFQTDKWVDPVEIGKRIDERSVATTIVMDKDIADILQVPPGTKAKRSDILEAQQIVAANRRAEKSSQNLSHEELRERARTLAAGIASGMLDPNPERYGTNRDGLRSMLAEELMNMEVDLSTLRLNWAALQKGTASSNNPQQLRMRQAAQAIPGLVRDMQKLLGITSTIDPATGEEVFVWDGGKNQLQTGTVPVANMVKQLYQQATGKAGGLKQYNIIASKLAMEQAFMISGGNQPPSELYLSLKHSYGASDNPENIIDALEAVITTLEEYQRGLADVGPITGSSPYQMGEQQQNPWRAGGMVLGRTPPAGTAPPAPPPKPGYVRIVHADGTLADIPVGYEIPPGWRIR